MSSDTVCEIELPGGALFAFPLQDPYWNRLLSRHFRYESEIDAVLHALVGSEFCFIDAGANFGYWSVLASARFGAKKVIAVEALGSNYAWLQANCTRNRGHYLHLHAAVSDEAGTVVDIRYQVDGPASSVGSKIATSDPNESSPNFAIETGVSTVTIDELAARHLPPDHLIVLKLDVEGAEIKALRGASNVLCCDCLVIFEDHGMDRSSPVVAALLDRGLTVLHVSEDGLIHRIATPRDATTFKKVEHKGYNFVAFKSAGRGEGALRRATSGGHLSPPSRRPAR